MLDSKQAGRRREGADAAGGSRHQVCDGRRRGEEGRRGGRAGRERQWQREGTERSFAGRWAEGSRDGGGCGAV